MKGEGESKGKGEMNFDYGRKWGTELLGRILHCVQDDGGGSN